jgi:uncharacterized HAD superfamily protein
MSEVFGIDFDGVVADTGILKQMYVRQFHKQEIARWQANRTWLTKKLGILTEKDYDKMLEYVCSSQATLLAPPVDGAIESIKALSERGDVYVITDRKDSWIRSCVEWMKHSGLDEYIAGCISSKEYKNRKLKICEMMGVTCMVEDDPGHFADASGDVKSILIGKPESYEQEGGHIITARNWTEAMTHLV